jgi:DedD protein
MATEDSDITIGPGKLLGLFFMLVMICGVFFAIGYSLGKTSAHEQAMNDKNPLSASLSAPVVGDSSAAKPSAAVPSKTESDASASQEQPAKQEQPDLTFFNAVKRSDHSAKQEPTQTATATAQSPAQTKSAEQPAPASAAPPQSAAVTPSPDAGAATRLPAKLDAKPVVTTAANGAFVVQIAAVTREEDAAALAGALRRKNYSVFVVNNPAVHDKFYHVQVGPFGTLQDAEAMKVKLTGEGYNPIVKRS